MSSDSPQSPPPASSPDSPGALRFAPGSRVRVKHGVRDPNYDDMPLGGWAGSVLEVDPSEKPPLYLVGWNERTLREMHPVFLSRCERDGLGEESMWLLDDDLEPDTGEPVAIEQPTALVTRPLDPSNEEDRIRAILGKTSDDPLPEVSADNLHRYHAYLAQHLSFPFAALLVQENSFRDDVVAVMVLGLIPAEEATIEDGLFVRVAKGEETAIGPLAEVEVPEEDAAHQLLSDYVFWLVNGDVDENDLTPRPEPGTIPLRGRMPALPIQAPSLSSLLLTGGVLCAVLGAMVASVVECVDGGLIGVPIGAGVVGLLGLLAGVRYGRIFGAINGIRSGGRFGAVFGLLFGVLLGTLAGALAVAIVGTILGSIGGSFFGRGLRYLKLRAGRWPWGLIGAWAGDVALAGITHPERFGPAALFGAAAGALLGVLLALVFLLTLAFLFGGRQS